MREDWIIKKLRTDISTKRVEVTRLKRSLDSLDQQYKRVIDELRQQVIWLLNNAPKTFFLYLINKIKRKVVK